MYPLLHCRDSLKIAISGRDLDSVIRPELREEYFSSINDHWGEMDLEANEVRFMPRKYCQTCNDSDKKPLVCSNKSILYRVLRQL